MNKDEKAQVIQALHAKFQRSTVAIVAHYRGLTVAEMTDFRRRARSAGVEVEVVKNTLARRATKDTSYEPLINLLTGPTSLVTSQDPVAPAKVLMEFTKARPKMQIVGGVLNGAVIDPTAIAALATLPSREVLLAKLLGTMNAPVQNFVGVLAALPRGLVRALDQIRQQKEQQQSDTVVADA